MYSILYIYMYSILYIYICIPYYSIFHAQKILERKSKPASSAYKNSHICIDVFFGVKD